jgi:hypothetical protein
VRRVAASLAAGLLCGAVIGGLGGRLAMFVLRLTSDDRIIGLKTDDDFTIGSFTSSTFFLVFVCALLGVVAGAAYGLASGFVPMRARVAVSALLFGAIGGAVILQPGEFDFTFVDPPVLTVLFFVLVPALFGAALAWMVERLAGDDFELQGLPAGLGRAVLAVVFAVTAVDTVAAAVDII